MLETLFDTQKHRQGRRAPCSLREAVDRFPTDVLMKMKSGDAFKEIEASMLSALI